MRIRMQMFMLFMLSLVSHSALAIQDVTPRPTPPELAGKEIMFTLEETFLPRVSKRVEPSCAGVEFSASGSGLNAAVVDVYVKAATGEVLFSEVVQAENRAIANSIKSAVSQWRFQQSLPTEIIIASPVTFYYSRAGEGECTTK